MFNSFIWILVWCGIVAVLSPSFMETALVNGNKTRICRRGFAVLVFIPLIIMVTNRGFFGDTYAYMTTFINSPKTFSELSEYVSNLSKDKGFYATTAFLRIVLGENYRAYFFVLAVVQSYFLMKIYRKYSSNYALSFFLFIASTDYISWMYNGIRQFTAVTIVFGAFGLILKKKYILSIIVILIASLFHGTALLMLPFIFICQGKAWNRKTIMFLIAALLAIIFVGRFTNIMDSALQGTQYQNVVTDYTVGELAGDDGTNPFRVFVYSIPAILSLWGRKRIQEENDSVINLCTNMSIVAMGLYLISMVTSGIFLGRIPIYFSLYTYILLPWEIDNLFSVGNRKLVKVLMESCYLGFYYYQMYLAWSLI